MTTRILPREEWHRLSETDSAPKAEVLPDTATVVVVEDRDSIVGCHIILPVLHAESLWIHPDHRGRSSVARRLWSTVRKTVIDRGSLGFVTHAQSDQVRELLAHVGAVRLDGEAYVVSVKG